MRLEIILIFMLFSSRTLTQPIIKSDKVEHTFNVDQVKPAAKTLPEKEITSAISYKTERNIKHIPLAHKNLSIIATQNNALIQTVQICYDEHRPLKLSPDVVWLAICQGVSIHLNQNFEKFSTQFLRDESTKKIVLRRRDDSLSFINDNWINIIAGISKDANQYLKVDCYNFFVPKFTTSNAINKTVFEITMLDAFKQKFEYVGETGCGIPQITITGTPKDWQWIYNNLDSLVKFDLEEWSNELKPIIQQFINASKGNADIAFWQKIYKSATEYNAYYLSGWVIKFFPYIAELGDVRINDTSDNGLTKINLLYKPNPYLYKDEYLKSTLSTNDFPSGIASIDFTWENYKTATTTYLQFFGGFMGIKQNKDRVLEPFISWALTDTNFVYYNKERKTYPERIMDAKHKEDYWSPNFADKVTSAPIFDMRRFKTTEKSLEYLRQIILDSIQQCKLFNDSIYKGKKIAIEILSNGKSSAVYFVEEPPKSEESIKEPLFYDTANRYKQRPVFFDKNNTIESTSIATNNIISQQNNDDNPSVVKPSKIELFIKHILDVQKEKWFPALAHPVDVLEINDASKTEMKLKVKVNSIVFINL